MSSTPDEELPQIKASAAVAIRRTALAAILDHARAEFPREACGVLAGFRDIEWTGPRGLVRGVTIVRTVPVRNIAVHEGRFDTESLSLLAARVAVLESRHQLLGYYHSHTRGNLDPSPADIDGGLWPGVVAELHLIASPGGDAALYQVWTDGWHRIPFELEDDPPLTPPPKSYGAL